MVRLAQQQFTIGPEGPPVVAALQPGVAFRRKPLSGGQRRRLDLALGIVGDPELLFLDEPTSGLDPSGTREVIALIHQMAREGRTIVIATHFLGEAGRLATHMAVLYRGKLHAYGRPADLAADLVAAGATLFTGVAFALSYFFAINLLLGLVQGGGT